MKDKLITILVVILFTIVYYYSAIYIPAFCYYFDFIIFDKYPDWGNWSISILTLISSLIILILAYVCVKFAIKIFNIAASEKQVKGINKYYLFLLSVLGGISFVLVQYFFNSIFFNDAISSEVKNFELWYLPALFTTCFTFPIAEEIFFRKGIFNILDSKFSLIISTSLSSILFASVHFPNYSQIITTFIGGVLLGILYKKTNQLIYPIAFHISWNITVVILNFIPIL